MMEFNRIFTEDEKRILKHFYVDVDETINSLIDQVINQRRNALVKQYESMIKVDEATAINNILNAEDYKDAATKVADVKAAEVALETAREQ